MLPSSRSHFAQQECDWVENQWRVFLILRQKATHAMCVNLHLSLRYFISNTFISRHWRNGGEAVDRKRYMWIVTLYEAKLPQGINTYDRPFSSSCWWLAYQITNNGFPFFSFLFYHFVKVARKSPIPLSSVQPFLCSLLVQLHFDPFLVSINFFCDGLRGTT